MKPEAAADFAAQLKGREMDNQQIAVAEAKLRAYQAAILACTAGKSYSMSMGGSQGPTVAEIRSEAERLWTWMAGDDKTVA